MKYLLVSMAITALFFVISIFLNSLHPAYHWFFGFLAGVISVSIIYYWE